MTDTFDLDTLETLEKAATPIGDGWTPVRHADLLWHVRTCYRDEKERRIHAWPVTCNCGAQPNEANAKFIAALRNSAPALIAAARERDELRKERDEADFTLVDKYRDPKHGHFSFPADVASIVRRLDKTEACAAEMRDVLLAYEAWEADLIMNGDWSCECVRITQAQHDRMLEIQAMRNTVLGKP